MDATDAAALLAAGTAMAGLAQAGAGWWALRRFLRTPQHDAPALPSVTVLKPLHGDGPLLEAALETCFTQDYPAYQLVFAVQDRRDPALAAVGRLQARYPHVDAVAVVNPATHGANRKIGNLLNAWPAAKHGVIVIADDDMHATPDYLRALVGTLMQPGVGLATTLYTGLPHDGSLAARLGAAQINHSFLPGALMARSLGREDCLGASMALRRDTLERIGGLQALADHLADDAVLGRLVQAAGGRVALAGTVPATTVPESSLRALFQHELRWARTIRSLAPAGFVLSVLQYPLFWAALALLLAPGWQAAALFGLAWAARGAIAQGVERSLGIATHTPIWCLPLRDALSVAVMLASYRSDRVAWRGQTLRATRPVLAPQAPVLASQGNLPR